MGPKELRSLFDIRLVPPSERAVVAPYRAVAVDLASRWEAERRAADALAEIASREFPLALLTFDSRLEIVAAVGEYRKVRDGE